MNTSSQRQISTPSFGERMVLAAILALIALAPRLTALRTRRPPFAPPFPST
jgi:hypothetical protein